MLQSEINMGQWSFTVVIEPDEDGGFVAHCPELKGCWSQGETIEETLHNIADAITGWLTPRIQYAIDTSAAQALAEEKPTWPLTVTVRGL